MIASERNKYIASHVRPEIKEELYQQAKRMKMSVSALIAEAVETYLKSLGCQLPPEETK